MSEYDSEDNGPQESEDSGPQEEEEVRFDRGSLLSIFQSDRREDFLALFFAMSIALGVYLLY